MQQNIQSQLNLQSNVKLAAKFFDMLSEVEHEIIESEEIKEKETLRKFKDTIMENINNLIGYDYAKKFYCSLAYTNLFNENWERSEQRMPCIMKKIIEVING